MNDAIRLRIDLAAYCVNTLRPFDGTRPTEGEAFARMVRLGMEPEPNGWWRGTWDVLERLDAREVLEVVEVEGPDATAETFPQTGTGGG